MTSPDSATMEIGSPRQRPPPRNASDDAATGGGGGVRSNNPASSPKRRSAGGGRGEEDGGGDGDGVNLMWDAFSGRFREVQELLDQNRALIAQADENHQSRIPENLAKNVALIREINHNISKIVSLYSGISLNFSTQLGRHRRRPTSKKACPAVGGS